MAICLKERAGCKLFVGGCAFLATINQQPTTLVSLVNNKMKRWAIIYLLHLSIMTHAQSVSTLVGARAAGMGYASSVLVDETALFNNVGAMAENKKPASFFNRQ